MRQVFLRARPAPWLCVVLGLAASGAASAQNAVTDWNEILRATIRTTNTGTPVAARAIAVVNTAVFDAVNTIDIQAGGVHYTPYLVGGGAPAGASRAAATASAAHTVMTALFPTQAANLTTQYNAYIAGLGATPAVADGAVWGATVGAAALSSRTGDGSSPAQTHVGGGGIGGWTGNFTSAQYATVTPFAMTSPSQFRPGPSPALNSAEYAADWDLTRRLGSATSAERTADQTESALFWRLGGGSSTPAGIWLSIANQAVSSSSLTVSESARLFAAIGVSLADSAISSWDAKVTYDTWRPPAAIQQADFDGNPLTTAEPTWTPLATETSPEFTSGSSTFGAAASSILAAILGDATSITLTSEFNNIDVRSWTSFSDMATDQGISRIYLGGHFNFSNLAGQQSGSSIADYVLANYFQLVPAPGAAVAIAPVALLALRRRRAHA